MSVFAKFRSGRRSESSPKGGKGSSNFRTVSTSLQGTFILVCLPIEISSSKTTVGLGVGLSDYLADRGVRVRDIMSSGLIPVWNSKNDTPTDEKVHPGDVLMGFALLDKDEATAENIEKKLELVSENTGYKDIINGLKKCMKAAEKKKKPALYLKFLREPESIQHQINQVRLTVLKDKTQQKISELEKRKENALQRHATREADEIQQAIDRYTNHSILKAKQNPRKSEELPDQKLEDTSGFKAKLSKFRKLLADPDEFTNMMKFLGAKQKQQLLFICEVDQLMDNINKVDAVAATQAMHRIFNKFLSVGSSSMATELRNEESIPALPEILPLLRHATRTHLHNFHKNLILRQKNEKLDLDLGRRLLESSKKQVEEEFTRQYLQKYLDYRDGKTIKKVVNIETQDLENPTSPYEFDDVLSDTMCFRSYLLFLMDVQRYQLLLFWKDCQDVKLDSLAVGKMQFITPKMVTEACPQIVETVAVIICSYLKNPSNVIKVLCHLHQKYTSGIGAARCMSSLFPRPHPFYKKSQTDTNKTSNPIAQYIMKLIDKKQLFLELVDELHSVMKKVDRILRFEAWSMFILSPHHATLVSLSCATPDPRNSIESRSLMSYLKQQPITQDMAVVDCQRHEEKSDGYHPQKVQKRLIEYLYILHAGPNPKNPKLKSKVSLLRRYPREDHEDIPFPPFEMVSQLCFPFNADVDKICNDDHANTLNKGNSMHNTWGFKMEHEKVSFNRKMNERKVFNFLIQKDQQKLYGSCSVIDGLYAVCILSSLPLVTFLREALFSLPLPMITNPSAPSLLTSFNKDFLKQERMLARFTERNSLFHFQEVFKAKQAAINIPHNDISLHMLFEHLSPERVVSCLEAMLMEQKLILLSSNLALLTVAAESLMSLLYPFKWNYIYLPLLPVSLFKYMQCPTPFLMGIHSCYLEKAYNLAEKDVIFVNLDMNEISSRAGFTFPRLPSFCRERIKQKIKELYFYDCFTLGIISIKPSNRGSRSINHAYMDYQLRTELMQMWSFLLTGWRQFCVYLPDNSDPSIIFDCPSFLRSRKDSIQYFGHSPEESKAVVDFLKFLVFTSYFPIFVNERTDDSYNTGLQPVSMNEFDMYQNILVDKFNQELIFFTEEAEKNRTTSKPSATTNSIPETNKTIMKSDCKVERRESLLCETFTPAKFEFQKSALGSSVITLNMAFKKIDKLKITVLPRPFIPHKRVTSHQYSSFSLSSPSSTKYRSVAKSSSPALSPSPSVTLSPSKTTETTGTTQ